MDAIYQNYEEYVERETDPAINFVVLDGENSGINATFDLKPVTANQILSSQRSDKIRMKWRERESTKLVVKDGGCGWRDALQQGMDNLIG